MLSLESQVPCDQSGWVESCHRARLCHLHHSLGSNVILREFWSILGPSQVVYWTIVVPTSG